MIYGRNQLQQYCNYPSIKITTFQERKKKKDLFLRFFVAVLDSPWAGYFSPKCLERKENILVPPKDRVKEMVSIEQNELFYKPPKSLLQVEEGMSTNYTIISPYSLGE